MSTFLSRASLARLFFASLAVAIPFAGSGGCNSRTACLQYTQPEYRANGNACPLPKDALESFTSPSCPGPITSVDGDGSYDGTLCCYPVTYGDITPDCGQGGSGAGGIGGMTTGFGGSTNAFASSTAFATTTGVGGATANVSSGGSCASTCAEAITNGGAPCNGGAAQSAYTNLFACAGCGSGGECAVACADFCNAFAPISSVCSACLMPPCTGEVSFCANN